MEKLALIAVITCIIIVIFWKEILYIYLYIFIPREIYIKGTIVEKEKRIQDLVLPHLYDLPETNHGKISFINHYIIIINEYNEPEKIFVSECIFNKLNIDEKITIKTKKYDWKSIYENEKIFV